MQTGYETTVSGSSLQMPAYCIGFCTKKANLSMP